MRNDTLDAIPKGPRIKLCDVISRFDYIIDGIKDGPHPSNSRFKEETGDSFHFKLGGEGLQNNCKTTLVCEKE